MLACMKLSDTLVSHRYVRTALFPMASSLCVGRVGYSENVVLQKKQHKIVAQDFSQTTTPLYYSLQETEACKFVQSALDDPNTLEHQLKV